MEVEESNWLNDQIESLIIQRYPNYEIVTSLQKYFYFTFGKRISRDGLTARVKRKRRELIHKVLSCR